MKESDTFLTSRAVAQQLGVSLRTVQLWVENGTLRAWKTAGGHRRISKKSVEVLLQQQRAVFENKANNFVLTVVVIEDDPIQLHLYEMNFENLALPVNLITATNGYEGLLKIGRYKPDFIITDLDMPGMDGFEMIRTISINKEMSNTQIVVVTGLDKSEILERGGQLPVNIPLFQKPIPFDELKAMLLKKSRISLK